MVDRGKQKLALLNATRKHGANSGDVIDADIDTGHERLVAVACAQLNATNLSEAQA